MARSPLLVGVLHLPPLPGSPRSQTSVTQIAETCAAEAATLARAGFDALVVENFGDVPFFADQVPAITVSAMTRCALAVRASAPALGLGINVLRNDAAAALSIAHAVGAQFIRINVHTGARVTDQGVVTGRAAETLRLRKALGAESVAIWADVDVKHSAPLAVRSRAAEAEEAVFRAMADMVLVTGEGTGKAVDASTLEELQPMRAHVPVLVASGATIDSLETCLRYADGVIVGSALRAHGVAGAALDEARVEAFARRWTELRGARS